ncbi:hypothetical protein DOY81_001933, partial [Sarcophaga bullata]
VFMSTKFMRLKTKLIKYVEKQKLIVENKKVLVIIKFRFLYIMSRSFNNQEQLAANTYDVLQRTGESLQRSNQIAFETEQIGTEVLSELSEQRESLLRSTRRLENADDDLSQSRSIIRKLQREVLYNKLILILIIVFELAILVGLILIKFIKL